MTEGFPRANSHQLLAPEPDRDPLPLNPKDRPRRVGLPRVAAASVRHSVGAARAQREALSASPQSQTLFVGAALA
jgi:hypothetical protein